MIRYIKDRYYITKKNSKTLYEVTKDLVCTCPGYRRWNHCKHQVQVQHYIEHGDEVDLARVPWRRP